MAGPETVRGCVTHLTSIPDRNGPTVPARKDMESSTENLAVLLPSSESAPTKASTPVIIVVKDPNRPCRREASRIHWKGRWGKAAGGKEKRMR